MMLLRWLEEALWAGETGGSGGEVLAEVSAAEPVAEPEAVVVEPEAEPESAPEPAPEPEPEPSKPDWRDARLAKKTAQLKAVQEELAKIKAAQTGASPQPSEAEIDARAEEKAAKRAFDQACNDAADQGRKEFPDWEARVNAVAGVVDRNDSTEVRAYHTLVNAALETGQAHRVMYELGRDPAEAVRVLALSPVKMAMEIAKMTMKEAEPVTKAPKPIIPVKGSVSHAAIDPTDPDRGDKLSTREWMNRRNAQIAARPDKRASR